MPDTTSSSKATEQLEIKLPESENDKPQVLKVQESGDTTKVVELKPTDQPNIIDSEPPLFNATIVDENKTVQEEAVIGTNLVDQAQKEAMHMNLNIFLLFSDLVLLLLVIFLFLSA